MRGSREVLRGIAPFPQPQQKRNPGGDCFACAMTAVVRAEFPDRPIQFEQVWEAWKVEASDGSKVLSNSWPTCWTAAHALGDDYRMECRYDLVRPETRMEWFSQAWGQVMAPEEEWSYRLEAWLSAGWLAMVEVNLSGGGPFTEDLRHNVTDHFIVLDGMRHYWKAHEAVSGAWSLKHDAHVVCSARGCYWIGVRDLLLKHGANGLFLMRRALPMEPL